MIRKKAAMALCSVGLGAGVFAGFAHAQGPGGPGRGFGGPFGGPGGFGEMIGGFMSHALDLTDAQIEQIKAIAKQAFDANADLRAAIAKQRDAEIAAVKANKPEAELTQLAGQSAALMARLHAAQLVAGAKMYQVLTPAQREKLDKIRADMQERFRGRGPFGHRPPAE
ncbi:MAG: Spy/CpxP family protein refolding chaperone [Bryobacteraceae bacterium]